MCGKRLCGLYFVPCINDTNNNNLLFHEIIFFQNLINKFKSINQSNNLDFGNQNIWGNLFHVTLIGFVELGESELNPLKFFLQNYLKTETTILQEINLQHRISLDENNNKLLDLRFNFKSNYLYQLINAIGEYVEIYKEKGKHKKLRTKNDYHASLLSNVKFEKVEEIINYLRNYKDLIPNLFKYLETLSTNLNPENHLANKLFGQLEWGLKIVSYEDKENILNTWKDHEFYNIYNI
ncbi:hypothetical protein ABK040_014670 [Willaertia magna]